MDGLFFLGGGAHIEWTNFDLPPFFTPMKARYYVQRKVCFIDKKFDDNIDEKYNAGLICVVKQTRELNKNHFKYRYTFYLSYRNHRINKILNEGE